MRKRDLFEESEESSIDMTPMLDIVFIMLIFFIVTTSFVREAGIDINRPTAKNSEQKKSNESILIAITNSAEIWIDKRQVDIRAVRANIQKMAADQENPIVIIQADKDAKTGLLVAVMDQAKMAGIANISIAAKKE